MLVEAAGVPGKTIPEMEKALAIDGKIVLIGMAAGRTPMNILAIQAQGAHVHGARGHAGHDNFPSLIRLMASGRVDMTLAATGSFPLANALGAIREAAAFGAGKILVKP